MTTDNLVTQIPSEIAQDFMWSKPGEVIEGWKLISCKLFGTSRWGTIYELVVEHDGAFWRFLFETGATEMQDYSDADMMETIEARRVEPVVVETIKYVEVKDV